MFHRSHAKANNILLLHHMCCIDNRCASLTVRDYFNCINIWQLNSHLCLVQVMHTAAGPRNAVQCLNKVWPSIILSSWLLSYHRPAASYAGAEGPERRDESEAPKIKAAEHMKRRSDRNNLTSFLKICLIDYKMHAYGIHMGFIVLWQQYCESLCAWWKHEHQRREESGDTATIFFSYSSHFLSGTDILIWWLNTGICVNRTLPKTNSQQNLYPALWSLSLSTYPPQPVPSESLLSLRQIKYLLTNRLLYCLSQVSTDSTGWTSESLRSLPLLSL